MTHHSGGNRHVDLVCYDLGTNSFRWLAAKLERYGPRIVDRGRAVIGLGRDMRISGEITLEAQNRAKEALRRWRPGGPVVPAANLVRAIATHALRAASNGAVVQAELSKMLGYPVEIVDTTTEARLAFAGAGDAVDGHEQSWALLDIGGGSTELSWGQGRQFRNSISLPVGVVTLIGDRNESLGTAVRRASEAVESAVRDLYNIGLFEMIQSSGSQMLASSCGTSSALSQTHRGDSAYERERLNGHWVPTPWLQNLVQNNVEADPETLAQWPGVGTDRSRLMGPGIGLLSAFLSTGNFSGWHNVESGLLEGIMHTTLDNEGKA